jgi:DNA ligase-1
VEAFAALFEQIDHTTSTNEKVRLMAEFFRRQDPDTCAWALYCLSGQRAKQLVGSAKLRRWAQALVGYPDWMMEECYAAVGDTAEMVALVLAAARKAELRVPSAGLSLGEWMTQRLLPLAGMDEEARRSRICRWWGELDPKAIFILNKLLTGALRVGVSEQLVYRALADVFALPQSVIASRLIGNWRPSAEFFLGLNAPPDGAPESDASAAALLPLPFCLASPLEEDPAELGDLASWQCEWKWDGVRCQAVKNGARLEIWSRGEERITGSFPDLVQALLSVSGDWILDGELVAETWRRPGSFQALQRRLNRKHPSMAIVASAPVSFVAYDLLQTKGESLRQQPLSERRACLEKLLTPFIGEQLGISPLLTPASWEELAALRKAARTYGAEGVMLKAIRSQYAAGRKRGIWFKWKIDPLTLDAVLTAAQPGTGRRASLYTDYTFSVWKGQELIPVAKAYSGLTDEEIRELDGWIRKHTIERFGPVRTVEPCRLFEIGFEGINRSERHKSGFAVRFPRILRERKDKRAQDADQVTTLEQLLRSLEVTSEHSSTLKDHRPPRLDQDQLTFNLESQVEPT